MADLVANGTILRAGSKAWIAMAPNGPGVSRLDGSGFRISPLDLPFMPIGKMDLGIVTIDSETKAGIIVNACLNAWEWPCVVAEMPSGLWGMAGLVASGSDALHSVNRIRDEGLKVINDGLDFTADAVPLVPWIAGALAILGLAWVVFGLARG